MQKLENYLSGRVLAVRRTLLLTAFLTLLCTCGRAQVSEWQQLAPGAGGQMQDLYFDPTADETIWLSSDVDGVYKSDDYGESWEFKHRTNLHAMAFKVRRAPVAGSTLWQGGLYGAHKSTDGGDTWTLVEDTRSDAIATIALSPDGQTVVLAPSWHTKDPQKGDQFQLLPTQPLTGNRTVYVSRDGGQNFTEATYESVDGYRQVFGAFVHPTTGVIYLGSAAGFYRSTNAAGTNYERVDNPGIARGGVNGGVNSITLFRDDGEVNPNGYRWSSACIGVGFTPNGNRAFASFQTSDRGWQVFSTKTSQLDDANPAWESMSTTGSGASLDTILSTDVMWYNLRVDPRSTNTNVQLLAGVTYLENRNRVGLYEGSFTLSSNNVTGKSWQQIMFNVNPKDTVIWTFDDGWEDPSFITRAYDYTPVSWGERRIIAGGGNTYYLSTDPAAANWPYNPDSWRAIYTEKVGSGPRHDTYTNKGFVNTISYDLDAYGDYAIQGNADHGILESFDGGVSWTKEAGGFTNSNCQAVVITKTEPPIVIAEARRSFGIPAFNVLNLRARLLTDPGDQPADEEWRQIGGNVSGGGLIAGMPNRIIKDFALDECHPSRVYAGLGGLFGVGGIYATEEIEAVFAGEASWREISDEEMRGQSTFDDVFVDPNNSNVLWAAGSHLYKGKRTNPNVWEWTKSSFEIGDLYVWDNSGKTVVAFVSELSGDRQIHVLTNPAANGISGTKAVGLTETESLQIRPEPWLDPVLRSNMNIEGLAGYDDKIIATTVVPVFKKSLGIFEGTISGTGNNTSVSWQDYGQDATGQEFYYPRDGTADAKIVEQTDGKRYYTLPTFGTGVWWRYVGDAPAGQAAIAVNKSGLRFGQQSGQTQAVELTASGSWTIVNNLPNWITRSTNGGTGNATVSFTVTKNNSLPYPRSAKARISSGGKIIEISLVQEGKPAQVKFSPGAFVVNAFQEAAWNGVPWNNIRRKVKGNTPDQQDRVRFAYNRNSLFVLVQVFDSTPLPGDSLRVGLDIGNDKEVAVRDEDLFFILDRSGNVYSDNATTVSRITAAARQVSNGYFYEFSVDWDDLGVIPFAGTGIGVDFKVSDDQTGTAATTEHFSQFFADSDLLTNVPLNWGNAELVGSDIPWFEDFQFDTGVTQDDGPTAWTIDAANIDPTGIFAVERSSRGTRFEARKLKAEAAWLSETIDISTSDFVKVGLDVFEVGANAGNYLRVYAKVDGGPEELILALEGDTPEDETRTRLQTNGISGQDLQLVVRAFNDNGGTAYYFENVLVDFGDATNCPAPTTPTVDAVNQTSVDLSWTADLSGLALFEVGYRVAGTTNYTVVTVTNDDQLTISGLADNTDYEWRVRRDCAGENSSWVDGPDFSTVAPLNRQDLYYENFDLAGCTPTNVPVPSYPCYREQNVTYSGQVTFTDQVASSGYPGASGNYQAFLDVNGYSLEVTGIDSRNFANLNVSFGVKKNSKNDSGASLSVEVLNGSTVVSAIPVSLPVGDGTNAVWYSFTSPPGITIPAIANLGLRFTSTSNTKWKIDDIRVSGQQGGGITCNEPQSLQNISVDATSATVSWGAVPTATNGFQVAIRPVGGSYGGNTNLTGTQFTFTGLQQGTDYEWRVRSRCDAGANSDWVAATFSTTVPGSAELFREEHSRQGCSDGSSVIDNYTCYSAPSLSHDGTGIINGSQANGTYPGASQGRHVFLRSQGEFYRITGANGSQFSNLTLRFGVRKNQVNADGSNLRVEVTNNGGSNWTTATVPALPTGSGTNNTWYAVEIPFPIAAGNNVGVRFTADGSTRYRIDDVEVTGISSSSRTASGDGSRISGPAFSTYRLYPNPVTTTLHLRVAPTERLLRVAVYDFRGRLLRTAERAAQLDVSDLPAGTYLLRALTDRSLHIDKFTKL